MMSQAPKVSVSLTYTETEWQSILSFVEAAAKFRGGSWDVWAASFRTLVATAIQQSKDSQSLNHSKSVDGDSHPANNVKRTYHDHDDYEEEYASLYDIMNVSEDEYTMDELLDMMD